MASMSGLSEQKQQEMLLKERRANNAWHKLCRNKSAMVGLVMIVLVILIAVFGPILTNIDPAKMDLLNSYAKPGSEGHILGTDANGRDLLARLIYGARVSFLVAVGGMAVGAVIGILIGLVSGYCGGAVDAVFMRIMDGMSAFPFTLLALMLMTVLGGGMSNVILAIGIASVPGYARMTRGQVLIVKNEEYIKAVKALGAGNGRILFRHLLPNVVSELIVYATLNVASAILTEASLSFLGMGITPPDVSWGSILQDGQECIQTAGHVATFSGICILITVLGFNLLGDGIRDVLDPKMKK
ncbi:MAG: ABC transporter permease [Clostridiales bacterium]|nr:ABC transporter permease [Clostridiales bacterium]